MPKKPAIASDPEMQAFQDALLESVRQMKSGKSARTTDVQLTDAASARAQLGMSQSTFAEMMGVSVRTLQDWEQGRRTPSGAARTLLKVAQHSPDAIRAIM